MKTTDKTVITFRERPAGQPEALKAWFYPGREWGDHFVWDKSRAIVLAKESNEAVLSTPVVLVAAPVEVLAAAPIEAVTPAEETVEAATVIEPPPAPVVVAAVVAPEPIAAAALPRTASNLSLIGLQMP